MTASLFTLSIMDRLHENGWLTDERWVTGKDLTPWCCVTATRAEHSIRAAGATREEAWICAQEQANGFGRKASKQRIS